jgi:hypothetical protein
MPDELPSDLTFSQRMGLTPVRTALQVDSMDEALRNALWNVLDLSLWQDFKKPYASFSTLVVHNLWADYLKRTMESLPAVFTHDVVDQFREYFFKAHWYEVYDFVEFVANSRGMENSFTRACNAMLGREQSGYRFINKRLVPLTSEEEIAAVEAATTFSDQFKPVSDHLKSALGKLSDRKSPDYRNSIKESISAVEAMCRIVTGASKATLGDAVKKLKEKGVEIHPAFGGALEKMYGFTSDAAGIRHSLMHESTLDSADARFMLVACSAFVNYLKAKSTTTP